MAGFLLKWIHHILFFQLAGTLAFPLNFTSLVLFPWLHSLPWPLPWSKQVQRMTGSRSFPFLFPQLLLLQTVTREHLLKCKSHVAPWPAGSFLSNGCHTHYGFASYSLPHFLPYIPAASSLLGFPRHIIHFNSLPLHWITCLGGLSLPPSL